MSLTHGDVNGFHFINYVFFMPWIFQVSLVGYITGIFKFSIQYAWTAVSRSLTNSCRDIKTEWSSRTVRFFQKLIALVFLWNIFLEVLSCTNSNSAHMLIRGLCFKRLFERCGYNNFVIAQYFCKACPMVVVSCSLSTEKLPQLRLHQTICDSSTTYY